MFQSNSLYVYYGEMLPVHERKQGSAQYKCEDHLRLMCHWCQCVNAFVGQREYRLLYGRIIYLSIIKSPCTVDLNK